MRLRWPVVEELGYSLRAPRPLLRHLVFRESRPVFAGDPGQLLRTTEVKDYEKPG
jgi:hypothetical protein